MLYLCMHDPCYVIPDPNDPSLCMHDPMVILVMLSLILMIHPYVCMIQW